MKLRVLRCLYPALALAAVAAPWAHGAIPFRKVEATWQAGTADDLARTIDGWEASPKGWSLAGRFEREQSALFITEEPVVADLLNVSLYFMSGRTNASFAHFALRYTTDPQPSFSGRWEDLPMLNFGATSSTLKRDKYRGIAADEEAPFISGNIVDNLYWITARPRGKPITAFRIDVFPVLRAGKPPDGPSMSWAEDGDFVLTEFRAEVVSTTTNIALGAPVTATHPLFSQPVPGSNPRRRATLTADALTDGWPSTIAHPGKDTAGTDFSFQIDLGRVRPLDHLGLRQRGENFNLDRFGKMRVMLYAGEPVPGAGPQWQVLHRPDGSYPDVGEVDILRAADGQGEFRGRYLRIATENPVPLSPMLAEVEAYETRTARLARALADDRELPVEGGIVVPAGSLRLALHLEIPQSGKPSTGLFRWRIPGEKEEWLTSNSVLLEIPSPAAGKSTLEVQAAHSDGQWDASLFRLPIEVLPRFTETPAFFLLLSAGTLFAGFLVARQFSRRHIAVLRAQSALAAERSRIARNMHDDVGARLAQLAVLQEVFARQHALPEAARADLGELTQSARDAMASLDDAVWTVNPGNDTLTALVEHLAQQASSYLAPTGVPCALDLAESWPGIEVPSGARHEVAMAFKEALQNIVKHSGATRADLHIAMKENLLCIQLADNGRGMPVEPGGSGKDGLENMRRRMEAIGGACRWLPAESGGTVVEMQVPLKE